MPDFEKIAPMFAVLSTASLMAGIVFDVGYFSYVGFEYLYYLNIEDHLESAIIWAPTIVFTAFGIYFSGFSHEMLSRTTVRVLKTPGRPHKVLAYVIHQLPILIGMSSLLLAGSISSAAYGRQDFGLLMGLSLLVVLFLIVRYVLSKIATVVVIPRIPAYAALTILAGILLFNLGSYWGAKDVARAADNPSEFKMSDTNRRLLGVVRPISQGVITVDPTNQTISMLRFDGFVSISRKKTDLYIDENAKDGKSKILNWLEGVWRKVHEN